MRQYALAVLERKADLSTAFQTEPYETGWASEAIFFIRVEEIRGSDPTLNARVQISADGINWIDEGTAFQPVTGEGVYFVRVAHFGGWLRLNGSVEGKGVRFKVTIQLTLKE